MGGERVDQSDVEFRAMFGELDGSVSKFIPIASWAARLETQQNFQFITRTL